jgi:hypothetical protein
MKNSKTLKKTNKKERKSESIMQTETERENVGQKKMIEGTKDTIERKDKNRLNTSTKIDSTIKRRR